MFCEASFCDGLGSGSSQDTRRRRLFLTGRSRRAVDLVRHHRSPRDLRHWRPRQPALAETVGEHHFTVPCCSSFVCHSQKGICVSAAAQTPGAPSTAQRLMATSGRSSQQPDFSAVSTLITDAIAAHDYPERSDVVIGHNGKCSLRAGLWRPQARRRSRVSTEGHPPPDPR